MGFSRELPENSIDSLGSGHMQPISELSNGDIVSTLSSLPSGILTPTVEALSNMRNLDPAERLRYERKKDSQVMGIVVAKLFAKTTQGVRSYLYLF